MRDSQKHNFTAPNNQTKETVTIPKSTLQTIISRADWATADLLDFMKVNNVTQIENANIIPAVVSHLSYITGACKYYLGEKS